MTAPYYCKECGDAVEVAPTGEISRACGHMYATVIAERTSVLYGEGGVAPELSFYERIMAAVRKLQAAFA